MKPGNAFSFQKTDGSLNGNRRRFQAERANASSRLFCSGRFGAGCITVRRRRDAREYVTRDSH
jgi:hypothetical protein